MRPSAGAEEEALRPEARAAARPAWVYALVDPRDGSVHYIGRTVNLATRRRVHLGRECLSLAMADWKEELWARGLKPVFRVLQRTTVAAVATAEKRWILKARAAGWPLTNKNLGGGGMVRRRPL